MSGDRFVRGAVAGAVALATLVSGASASAAASKPRPGVRKDVSSLTARERSNFVRAVLKLKKTPSPYDRGLNFYDQFVKWHRDLYRCTPGQRELIAHGGPMFLPWHRAYVLAFENALRRVSGKRITVPYWDWTSPGSTRAALRLVGGDGDPDQDYAVTSGPFRKGRFRIRVNPRQKEYVSSSTKWVTRHVGSLGAFAPIPEAREVAAALAAPRYDASPWDNRADPAKSFRQALEGFRDPPEAEGTATSCGSDHFFHMPEGGDAASQRMHNAVHPWVGGLVLHSDNSVTRGTMMLPTSPNDPIFFLHHANVDRLWAIWQKRHGIHTYRPLVEVPLNNVDDHMAPFTRIGLPDTPRRVEDIARLGYRYRDMRGPPPAPAAASRVYERRKRLPPAVARLCRLAGLTH